MSGCCTTDLHLTLLTNLKYKSLFYFFIYLKLLLLLFFKDSQVDLIMLYVLFVKYQELVPHCWGRKEQWRVR